MTDSSTPNPAGPTPTAPAGGVAFRLLTYCLLMPLIALSTAAFGCVSLVCGLWDRSGRQQHAVAQLWARSLLLISFSPVTLVGEHHLSEHPVAVYASNHLSYMDTPVLFATLPFQFRILAKQALWKVPFVGWYLNRSGQVPIDQASGRSSVAGLLRGVKTLRTGLSLVLFPEGGRSAEGNLQTMLPGSAFMAIKAQVPLIPLALIGTYELLPIHTYHLTPRPLKVVVGTPIPTAGMTTRDAEKLTGTMYRSIVAMYAQHTHFEDSAD